MLADGLDIDIGVEFPGIETENESTQSTEEEEPVGDGYVGLPGKAIDPVRIYLKEMGSFPLLTREGEVEVAKRIERGHQEVLSVVLNCPISIREVSNLEKALRTGKTKIGEITNEIDDEETNIKEEIFQKEGSLDSSIRFRRERTKFNFFKRS